MEENQKTCYNSGYGITLYDEVHVHECFSSMSVFNGILHIPLHAFSNTAGQNNSHPVWQDTVLRL